MSTNSQGNNGNAPTEETKDWTIMLYITADGILTNFAVESLKQLNEAVSTLPEKGDASVIVAAHFSFPSDATNPGDATNPVSARAKVPGNETPPEYIFETSRSHPADSSKATSSKPVRRGLVLTLPDPVRVSKQASTSSQASTSDQANMSEKEALKAFLNGVYSNSKLNSKHYALILWGHGPELLLQAPSGNPTGDSNSLYLTPQELREVLTECTPPTKGSKLDIIGFDACFMSMSEMAGELKGLVDYMVASQDEVPDLSFPYACLVELFREYGKDRPLLLRKAVEGYLATYQDCICNNTTQMNPVTLTVLELDKCGALTEKVKSLAGALLRAKGDEGLPDGLIEARTSSKDYAGGLYVDLYDFCVKLKGQLGEQSDIGVACQGVIDALSFKSGNPLILTNGSVEILEDGNAKALFNSDEATSHGISIYLPYLTDQQYAQVQRPLVKGGTLTGKGFDEALQGAGIEYLMYVRRDLILDTESYYLRLKLADETNWYAFITEVWTRALMEKLPADLDYHYSAQQSWMNVTRKPVDIAKVFKPETPA